jgi:hypothetical protein
MHSSIPDGRTLVDWRGREHGLWLAMRSAYDNYREASETLDAVAARRPIAVSSPDRIWAMESLAAKQRIEFERYIEKRLQYSEFVRDRSNLAAMHFGSQRIAGDSSAFNQRQAGNVVRLRSMTSRIAVGAALLCIVFFILREQRQVHNLNVARDGTSATLNHTRDDRHSLSRQLSASSTVNPLVPRKVVGAAVVSLGPHPNTAHRSATAGKRAVVQPWNRIPMDRSGSRRGEVATALSRKYEEPVRSPRSGGRSYYWFTLTPSTQFKQVGVVGLSLRKDPKHRYFDLRLMFENSKVEKKHVKLDVPVWINAADRLQSVVLVLTRIQRNYVQGYLSESSHRRPETTATD